MLKYFVALLILIGLGFGAYTVFKNGEIVTTENPPTTTEPRESVKVIATDLEIPWDFAFLPDGGMLVTERTGALILIRKDGTKKEVALKRPELRGESGLLGMTLHPRFEENHVLYLYMTTVVGDATQNRVERYRYENETLTDDGLVIGDIPGATYHDGGRIEFGPDGYLYITAGDATRPNIAQDKNSLGGKILRVEDDGKIPASNPYGTAVWSLGHRNPQGLVWDKSGRLWETEHGPTGEQGLCCRDEINLITKGANYGWPLITGDQARSGYVSPAWTSGASTWAPASAALLGDRLFFGGLMGQALYEAAIDGDTITGIQEHFKKEYGRIRTVRIGPDGYLYFSTSNRDGRGNPTADDDRIIRIDPDAI